MSEPRHCAECGAPLPKDVADDVCPACSLRGALAISQAHQEATAQFAPRTPHSVLGTLRYFGDYELLEEIARGGMGIVFKARQVSLNRVVAIKMILAGQLASEADVQRFRAEAEAAANLQHANIVAIHEVGEHEGQLYFSMEYIEGKNLAELVRENPLPAKRAAEYVKTIAEAIHYAHDRGTLHRDLKPSNVLIDLFDQPRITDFGLAKQLKGDSDLTLTGQVLGSPNFMPPEQAAGKRDAVGPHSDVYSLGAILYHLLTGRPPFVADTMQATLAQVVGGEPPSPRLLNPAVPRDLETICLKCLEKESARRFATAQELSEELHRFLRDEPIRSRPVSRPEKIWRWSRRKPALATALVLLFAVFIAGVTGVLWQWRRAEYNSEESRRRSVRLTVVNGVHHMDQGNLFGSLPWFAEAMRLDQEHPDREELHRLRLASVLSQTPRLGQLWFHQPTARGLQFGADSRQLYLWFSLTNALQAWDSVTGEHTATFYAPKTDELAYWLSLDGQRLLTVSSEGLIQIRHSTTGEPMRPAITNAGIVKHLVWSDDERRLVFEDADSNLHVYDTESGAEVIPPIPAKGGISTINISPDGRLLAIANARQARIWSTMTGRPISRSFSHDHNITSCRFSPDTKSLVTTSWDRTARIWNATNGQPIIRPLKHNHAVVMAAFSPDGRWLVTSSYDDLVRIWDIATEELVVSPLPHRGRVEDAVFSPNGRRLATACNDGLVRIWELAVGEPFLAARSVTGTVSRLVPGSIPEHLLVIRSKGPQLWDTKANEPVGPVLPQSNTVQDIAFTRDDARVGILADSGIQVWDTRNAVPLTPLLTQSNGVKSLWFSWNGDRIFAWSGTTLSAWNASNGLPILHERSFTAHRKTKPVYSNIPALFPAPLKNRDLIIAIQDNAAQVWDLATGEPVGPLLNQEKTIESASMSPDGMRVVTSCIEGSCIWDLSSPQGVATPRRLKAWALHSEFDADGKRIVTGSMDTTARVWDALTGKPLTPPLQHSYHVYFASFSPDGKWVLTSSTDGTARVWDSLTGEPITPPLKHGSLQGAVPIHWNGRWVIAHRGSDKGSDKVWRIGQDERPLADWQQTAELLDNNRIGSAGDLTRSHRSTVLSNWLTLKAKYPGDFGSTREQAIYFHRRQASECENANQWAAAQFHIEQLIKEFPDDPKLQSRRETARKGLLQWDEDTPLPTESQIFPARNPRTPPELIDLSPHYNFALTNRLPEQKVPFGLELLPQGVQSFDGVEFDVRGIVLLSSSTLEALPKAIYRTQVRITISRKCQRLHFLHSCWDGSKKKGVSEGTRVGTYRIRYANEEVWDVPIVYGKDMRALQFTSQLNDTPNAAVAWTSLGLTTSGNARLYHRPVANPRPDIQIESIEFVSAITEAAPLLFAITVE